MPPLRGVVGGLASFCSFYEDIIEDTVDYFSFKTNVSKVLEIQNVHGKIYATNTCN